MKEWCDERTGRRGRGQVCGNTAKFRITNSHNDIRLYVCGIHKMRYDNEFWTITDLNRSKDNG